MKFKNGNKKKARLSESDNPVRLFFKRADERIRFFYNDIKRSGLIKTGAVFVAIIAFFAGLLWILERSAENSMFKRFFDGIWWAVVTIGTVGYGDKYPQTDAGRVAAIILILAGVIITALISGTVASIFVERRIREGKGLRDVKIKDQILICGWNAGAKRVLEGLAAQVPSASIILVNGLDAEGFDAIRAAYPTMDIHFVRGDHTQEAVLKRASLNQARSCILLPDESGGNGQANADERTILSALAIKSINKEIPVCAGILKAENQQHLKRAEIDDIIVQGEFSGFLFAAASTESGLPGAVRELLDYNSGNRLRQMPMPQALYGKTFAEASGWFVKNSKGILLGVMSREKPVTLDDLLSDNSGAIDAFIKRKFAEAAIDIGADQEAANNTRLAPNPDYVIQDTDLAFVVGGLS